MTLKIYREKKQKCMSLEGIRIQYLFESYEHSVFTK